MSPLSGYERRILAEIESEFAAERAADTARRRRQWRRVWVSLAVLMLCTLAAVCIALTAVRILPIPAGVVLDAILITLAGLGSYWLRTSRARHRPER